MPLPAVLTIQSGINKLRYATLMGIKKAKTKEIRQLTAAELGGCFRRPSPIERIYLPAEAEADADCSKGAAKEAAAQAGREAEVRGAGHMSVLVVLEQSGGVLHRMSWETLAAGHAVRQCPVSAVVLGAACPRALRQRRPRAHLRGRASGSGGLHRRRLRGCAREADPRATAGLRSSSRTPTRCATSRRSWRRASARCWSAM